MTTFLAAYAALRLRVFAFVFTVLLVLILSLVAGAHTAFGQEVVSMQPTYQGPPAVPTITLWRDGGILAAIITIIGVLIWRVTLIETWVRSTIRFQSVVSALAENELEKRGVQVRPTHPEPLSPPSFPPTPEDDMWAAEADKAAPPPPPRRGVQVVQSISTRELAQKLTPRTRAKGNA